MSMTSTLQNTVIIYILIIFKVYVFILKKGRVSRGGYETDGGIERILSRLHTVSMEPDLGLEPTNHEIMT